MSSIHRGKQWQCGSLKWENYEEFNQGQQKLSDSLTIYTNLPLIGYMNFSEDRFCDHMPGAFAKSHRGQCEEAAAINLAFLSQRAALNKITQHFRSCDKDSNKLRGPHLSPSTAICVVLAITSMIDYGEGTQSLSPQWAERAAFQAARAPALLANTELITHLVPVVFWGQTKVYQ